jgi:sporulation integral membrane protein YtvI
MNNPKFITYIKILTNFIVYVIIIALLFLVLPKLLKFFLPFVIGWIVSMIANPMVRFLEKKVKLLRKHSSAIIIIFVIALIVGAGALIITAIIREAKELIGDWPEIERSLTERFNDTNLYIHKITASLPEGFRNTIDNAIGGLGDSLLKYMKNIPLPTMSNAGDFVNDIAEGFLMIIVTILSAYFFAACREELITGLQKRLPESAVNYWRLVYGNFISAFGGYFKAQFKIMLILVVIMFAGFEILQVGYSFLIAFGIALLDVLPVFGTGAVLWPWALIEMISGNYIRAIGFVVIYLICQIVKQVLQPKMVGDSIGMHPLLALLSMFIGYRLYGVLGMIIFIPIGMVLVNMYRIGMFERLAKGIKIIARDLHEFRKF